MYIWQHLLLCVCVCVCLFWRGQCKKKYAKYNFIMLYTVYILLCCVMYFTLSIERTGPDLHFTTDYICVCVCVFQTGDCLFELRGHTQQITAMTSYFIIRGRNTHAALITASSDRTLSVSFTQASAAVCVCV